MAELGPVDGRTAIRVLEKLGFEVIRVRGSHHVLRRRGHPFVVTVPVHGRKELKRGTLRSIIRAAGLSPEEFMDQM